MKPLVTLSGIRVGHPASPQLHLDGALGIPDAHVAILGPSGAGKSTLLDVLAGFRKPDRGRVKWHVDRRPPAGWAPTDAGHWPGIPAWQQIALSIPGASRVLGDADRTAALEWLALLDLEALADAAPERMSAGERTRLLTLRALATGAPVALLDEPFSHVPMVLRSRYREALRNRADTQGTRLWFATHDPAAAMQLADHALCLDQGRLLHDGPVHGLYAEPPSEEVGALLGPLNWLAPEDWMGWVQGSGDPGPHGFGHCVRAEQLQVVPDQGGRAQVVWSSFTGGEEELLLRRDDGSEGRFHHRPAAPMGPSGTRVSLKVLVLVVCALLVGCGSRQGSTPFVPQVIRSLPPHDGGIPSPRGLASLADGGLLVLDTVGRVVRYGPQLPDDPQQAEKPRDVVATWMMPATDVGRPEGLCELRDASIAVADTHYHRVVRFGPTGKLLGMFGEQGDGPGQFRYPVTICTDNLGHLYVGEYGGNDRVQKFRVDGTHVCTFGPDDGSTRGSGPGQLERPAGIAWRDHKVYVADAVNHRVAVFRDSGEPLPAITPGAGAEPLRFPYDLCFDPQGRLLTVEHDAGRVTAFAPANGADGKWQVQWRIGSPGNAPGQLTTPWGLTVDRPSHQDSAQRATPMLWVADTGNRRLVGVKLP